MAKVSSDVLSLRDLSRADLDESDQDDFIAEITSGTDRAAALVASSIVDNDIARLLELILKHKDKKQLDALLYSPQAPLGSFSARIKIIGAIGIISPEVIDSLDTVRSVRNTFAHAQKPLSFQHPSILRACKKLPHTKLEWAPVVKMGEGRRLYLGYCITLSAILRNEIPIQWGNRPSLWAVLRAPSPSP